MASESLNKYIGKRYERWLDYSRFHCCQAGIGGEEIDVLNEVLAMLLEKPEEETERMLGSKQGRYTELDFYILQMIKLNATSDTSPYRHKYKAIPVDDNVDWRRLNVIDEPDDEYDKATYICDKTKVIRDILEDLHLSDRAKRIFSWKFFAGESFADWPGPESKKELYNVYKKTFRAIVEKNEGNLLI